MTPTGSIDLTALPDFGGGNSVAVGNGIVAVAVNSATPGASGHVAFYDGAGTLQNVLDVGTGPQELTFTPNGARLLSANEGEPVSTSNNPVARSASSTSAAARRPLR